MGRVVVVHPSEIPVVFINCQLMVANQTVRMYIRQAPQTLMCAVTIEEVSLLHSGCKFGSHEEKKKNPGLGIRIKE